MNFRRSRRLPALCCSSKTKKCFVAGAAGACCLFIHIVNKIYYNYLLYFTIQNIYIYLH